MIGVFSAAAVGPAELFRISISPPRCVRFFATSALESRSYTVITRDHCRWQILKARCANRSKNGKFSTKKSAKTPPHVQWLPSLAASCCEGLEDTVLAFVASLGLCFIMKLNVLHELPYLGELRIGSVWRKQPTYRYLCNPKNCWKILNLRNLRLLNQA